MREQELEVAAAAAAEADETVRYTAREQSHSRSFQSTEGSTIMY